ncbi:MAG: hypothetical protein ABIJ81_01470 [Patescibacteria group bacterium]
MVVKLSSKSSYLLVLNTSGDSLNWALYTAPDLEEIGRGAVERIGLSNSFTEGRLLGKLVVAKSKISGHQQALAYVLKLIAWHGLPLKQIKKVGHRVAFGSTDFDKPVKLNLKNLSVLTKNTVGALSHRTVEIITIQAGLKFLNKADHWAVFDTTWYCDLPDYSKYYALPIDIQKKKKLQRFGLHGISHQYVAEKTANNLNKDLTKLNLITCYLGGRSSITALRYGRVIDTSAGFTPLEGLMGATQSGDLDPGLVLHLIDKLKMKPVAVRALLNDSAGWLGVAGVKDMRELMVRAGYEILGYKTQGKISAEAKEGARLALKMYIYRVQKYIGAYAAILGRVDAIVFTGNIGERNETIRTLIIRGLPKLKDIPELIIPTNEELAIARQIVR